MKLFETIKIINGKTPFLAFHQARFDKTRQLLFHNRKSIDLQKIIQPPDQTSIYRCRIIYSTEIEQIEYLPYQKRSFKYFKLVKDDYIQYECKYVQREQINKLVQLKQSADDIIIIKQGWVTDTSIANIAFLDKNQWITSNTPLLAGTTRQRLLERGVIVEKEIKVTDLPRFSKMALMNALLGFYVVGTFEWLPPFLKIDENL